MSPPRTLSTPRLELRPLRLSDAAFVLGLLNQPSFLEHIGDKGVRNLADAERYLQAGPLAMYEQHGIGLLLVELRPPAAGLPPTPIGLCGLLQRDTLPEPDLGFALLPEHWGRGLAHEAAAAILAFGRADLGLRRILAVVAASNTTSRRLLERLGMQPAGTVRLTPDGDELCLYQTSAPSPGG